MTQRPPRRPRRRVAGLDIGWWLLIVAVLVAVAGYVWVAVLDEDDEGAFDDEGARVTLTRAA